MGAGHLTDNHIQSSKGNNLQTTTAVPTRSRTGEVKPLMGDFLYKTIAIYSDFADAGSALALSKKEGFSADQISLLGREQEHWQENSARSGTRIKPR